MRDMPMLRIELESQDAEEAVMKVEGWIEGADVAFMKRKGDCYRRHSKRLVLDLGGVKFIDEEGLSVLKDWSGRGDVLRGASAFVCKLLEAHGLPCSCDPIEG